MIFDQFLDSPQVRTFESIVCRQFNWKQPKLCFVFCSFDMDMRRFFSFIAEKEKAEPA